MFFVGGKAMRYNSSVKKAFIGKAVPKTVDTIKFNNRYFDIETVKEKATGIISVVILSCIAAFSFFFFI